MGPSLPVTEDLFEQRLAKLAANSGDPVAGFFGPRSLTWQVNRESALFVAAGRAALMQLAHPWVAAAIADHSLTKQDPWGRFHRTFIRVFAMVFGSCDQALDVARGLHAFHGKITGTLPGADEKLRTPYYANEANALLWVFATLVDSSVTIYQRMVSPLTAADRNRFYEESKRFALLFGIPDEVMPPRWPDFAAYVRGMSDSGALHVTREARAMADFLMEEPFAASPLPFKGLPRWYRTVTASLLDERLRDGFGLDWSVESARDADTSIGRLRRVYRLMPAKLRYVGPYHEALARLDGKSRADWTTRQMNRIWVGQPRLVI